MSTKSKIEWTEQTWNPATGCIKVSPGCEHCYAEVMANRLKAMGANGYENGFKVTLQPHRLQEPLQRKKPTVYFVNSMSDLFHEKIPSSYIKSVFDVIENSPWHTYQILTKRADRMADIMQNINIPPNAWMGVTVENIKHGLPRIDLLRKVNSPVRFLSIEPLLEDLGTIDLNGVHWVIVGGESGPKARPMKAKWVNNIKKQCKESHVPFFFKQWGGWGADGVIRPKKQNGRLLHGKTWDGKPEVLQPSFA